MKGAKSPFLLVLSVVLLLSLPSVARADSFANDFSDFVTGWYPHVVWSEDYSVQGNIDDYRHIIIDAASVNDAALLAISVGPSGVNNDVRAFLSDSNYSPHFANLVGSLSVMGDWDGFPYWAPSYVRSMCIDPTNCYVGTLDTYDVKQAYKEYLAAKQYAEDGTLPEDSGSSSTIFPEGDYYKIPVNPSSYTGAPIPSQFSQYASLEYLYVQVDLYTRLMGWLSSNYGNFAPYFALRRNASNPAGWGTVFYASRGVSIDSSYRAVNNGDLGFEGKTFVYDDYCILFWQNGDFRQAWYNSGTNMSSPNQTPVYFVQRIDPTGCPVVHLPDNLPAGDWSEPEPSVKWGVDIDWYDDTAEAPTGDTNVSIGGDTVYNTENNTYTTNYTLDVEPILQRLDKLNLMVAQIGIDLRTIDSDLVSGFSSVNNYLSQAVSWMRANSSILSRILDKMDELDKSTNDLVDLSSLESGVSALSGDIGALLSAVTGSHGSDALGIYGRLDTMLNWLDDYSPVDVSGIERILNDWPDYPVFDDSDLLNAITGSHGADLLGLFGRLDNFLSWLDSYVAPDLATLNHQLGDFTESDGQTLTVHGLLHWINYYAQDIDRALSEWPEQVATDLTVLNHQLGDVVESDGQTLTVHGLLHWINYYAQDIDRAVQDILALGTVTVDGTTYGFADLAYNTWVDLLRLVGMSSVTADGHTYSFADLLYNMWLDLSQFCDDFVSYWNGVFGKLDGIVSAIQRLDFKTAYPSSPNVPRPTQGDLRDRIDWSEWDNAVSTLSHKFPFVIINDIALIFAALTRPAVTPVFDLPVPNPSDWSSPYLLHVDLSDFDSVAAVMRVGITLWVIARVSRRTLALWTSNEGSAV